MSFGGTPNRMKLFDLGVADFTRSGHFFIGGTVGCHPQKGSATVTRRWSEKSGQDKFPKSFSNGIAFRESHIK